MDIRDTRFFVTGAASGIGRALALAAADRGAHILATDIDRDGLDQTARSITDSGGKVLLAEAADIADTGQVTQLAEVIHRDFGPVHVLANVAGVALFGHVQDMDAAAWDTVLSVNLGGVVNTIQALVPAMITAGRGHIVNVSSFAGLVGLPWHAAYSASKHAVNGLSESLRWDLARHNVGVTVVCPGAVNTAMVDRVRILGADQARVEQSRPRFRKHAVPPEKVAAACLTGIRKNRFLMYTSPDVRAVYLAKRTTPGLYTAVMRLASRVMDRKLQG